MEASHTILTGKTGSQEAWLRAGDLKLLYQNGFVRNIKIGKTEVVRMINHAVRDQNWATCEYEISNEQIQISDDGFLINYDCKVLNTGIDFHWQCRIEGCRNEIDFSIEGICELSFLKNRIGFTVLHPVDECAGRTVTVTKLGSDRFKTRFPTAISPHQPIMDIQAMEMKIGDYQVTLNFEGDVFEMEDQRNWMDHSFKTYCTPLKNPFPVQMNIGDRVSQRVRLKVSADSQIDLEPEEAQPLAFSSIDFNLPKMGIGQSTDHHSLSSSQQKTIREIGFDHYQADLHLNGDWRKDLRRIASEAFLLDLPIELSLFMDKSLSHLHAFIRKVSAESVQIQYLNVFSEEAKTTSRRLVREALPMLKKSLDQTAVGFGTNAFFAELNRERPHTEDADFVVYSANPQVHAGDEQSIIETIDAFPDTIKSAQAIYSTTPVHVSPITLKMRWNPNATKGITYGNPEVDDRQDSYFAATWLLGMISNALESGVEAMSFFETAGRKGIINDENTYPLAKVFRWVLVRKHKKFGLLNDSNHFTTRGIWVDGNEGTTECLIANLSRSESQVIIQPQYFLLDMEIWSEHAESATQMGGKGIYLPPYAIAHMKIRRTNG